ncbi:hypothetical protein H5410_064072 [Solanum commersonii]|uniref:Uncharacterized protein n=1 Tax=Solanum commersonii TaxID=4109 RepID=A0A9J5W0B6_SOLCO|nr:hypothetical protein H5410_064072 [Solanum commersonii]
MERLALAAKATHFQDQSDPDWPSAAKAANFQGQAIRVVHGFFGDPEFRPHIYLIFTWTSVKTLPMKPVGPNIQNGPFSKSNDPRAIHGFLVIQNFDLIFAKILPGHPLRPYLWSGWPSRPKRPIFKSNDPEAGKPPFYQF